MSCQDCAGCDPDLMPVDPFPAAGAPAHHAAACRFCPHPLGSHTLADVRARLPGLQFATTPPPGSKLDRLQKLVAAEEQGLITRDELTAATRRLMREPPATSGP